MTPEIPKLRKEQIKLVEGALKTLSEHFDAVHIFATSHEASVDGTGSVNMGSGNHHTRVGLIKEWIIREDERIKADLLHRMGLGVVQVIESDTDDEDDDEGGENIEKVT